MSDKEKPTLVLGAGSNAKEGVFNVDIYNGDNIDCVYNLNSVPWVFSNRKFKGIKAHNVLEHLKITSFQFLKECSRFMVNGSTLDIMVPHPSSSSYHNENHKRGFWLNSFDNYLRDTKYKIIDIEKIHDTVNDLILIDKRLIFKPIIFNFFNNIQRVYENSFLRFVFQAQFIRFVFKKVS